MGWLGPFVWRVPGEKTAELAKAESCRSEAAAAKFNRLTMHVEARSETSRDAGSIPAASIGFLIARSHFFDLFIGLSCFLWYTVKVVFEAIYDTDC